MAARNAEKQIPPSGTALGLLLYHAPQGFQKFRPRHSATRSRARNAVCIFNLVLRALDTLVDSSVPIPSFSDETKTNLYLKATELTKNTEEVDGKVQE